MQEIIFIVHIIAVISLICLVLLQRGKGADMGASFGSGASNTMFGSTGSMSFFTKITAFIAVTFFITSIALGVMVAKQAKQIAATSLIAEVAKQSQTELPKVAIDKKEKNDKK